MKVRNLTILVAHPDDELIFGWPVLVKAKKIITCVDDMTHGTRQWCRGRKAALEEICAMLGTECEILRFDSGFSRLPQENGSLRVFVEAVRKAIKDEGLIFTHNAWGEYGHLDHVLINSLARQSGKTIWTTDICMDADWYRPHAHEQGLPFQGVRNDMDLYRKCVEIYRKHGAFGWPYEPIQECNLIEVAP
jgi:hypothetical protein